MGEQDGRDPLIGAQIGNYVVASVLGEGGMGRVYRAHHPDLDRVVAIKVLAIGLASSSALVGRFRTEARAVNKIRHGNIVDIHDFGTLPDGRPYYAMELLDGEDLAALLRRVGELTPAQTCALLVPVLDALDAAHRTGVVHRDLKPDNIFLIPRAGQLPLPKLLDFGVAKVLGELAQESPGSTQAGSVMGTPLYMSPEQAAGRSNEVGPSSDLYSIGVIAYQMLCGATPFPALSLGELILAHLQTTPTDVAARRPDVPPELGALVMAALAKDPAARPPSAAAMRDALARIAAGLPPPAPFVAVAIDKTVPALGTPVPPGSRPPVTPSPSPVTPSPVATPGYAATPAPAMATAPPAPRGRGKAIAIGAAIAAALGGVAIVAMNGGDRPSPPPSPTPAAVDRPPEPSPTPAAVDRPPTPAAVDRQPEPSPTPPAVDRQPTPPAVDRQPSPQPSPSPEPQSELERRLEALKRMHTDGLISAEEYDARRRAILDEEL